VKYKFKTEGRETEDMKYEYVSYDVPGDCSEILCITISDHTWSRAVEHVATARRTQQEAGCLERDRVDMEKMSHWLVTKHTVMTDFDVCETVQH